MLEWLEQNEFLHDHIQPANVCSAQSSLYSPQFVSIGNGSNNLEETTEQAIRSVCECVGITSSREAERTLKAIACNKQNAFMSSNGLKQKPLLCPAPVTLGRTSLLQGWDLNCDFHLPR